MLKRTIDFVITVDVETQFNAEGKLVLDENVLQFQHGSGLPNYLLPF